MRRLLLPLILLSLLAVACGDDGDATAMDVPTSSTTVAPDPGPTSPLAPPASTTTEPQGMCGDLVPVVTDEGTTCVDPDEPVTTTLSPSQLEWPGADFWEGTIPPLLVADGTLVSLLVFDEEDKEAFTVEPILETPHPVFEIRQAADGTIFTQEIIEDDGIETFDHVVAVYRPGASRVEIDGAIQLFDVAIVDGVESVVLGLGSTDELGYGGVVARSVDELDVDRADFGLAAEAEFWVTHADYADDRLVYTAISDLTETVGYRGEAGATFTPTEGIEYNAPPFVTAASLSADAETVYWAEGPDWDGRVDDFEGGWVEAEWRLRGADVATGEESLSWPLSEPVADTGELNIESVIDLGDHILVNRSMLSSPVGPSETIFPAALVLDFTFEEPWLRELPIPGVAAPAAT